MKTSILCKLATYLPTLYIITCLPLLKYWLMFSEIISYISVTLYSWSQPDIIMYELIFKIDVNVKLGIYFINYSS